MVQELNPFKPGKIIAGLTGGFGAGKSTVGRLFEDCGAFRIDADVMAHQALLKTSKVYGQIAGLFGDAVDEKTGNIDRASLAAVVFNDSEKRRQLESLVHPFVLERMAEEAAKAAGTVVILEIPLLFETGMDRYTAPDIVVKADKDIIRERLRAKGFDDPMIEKRWSAQLPMEEKIKRADIIIDNSKSLEDTKRQVEEIWKKLF